jgi:30S ribosomal protein S31
MGKGDKKTKRGKIVNGSFGKKRPRSTGKKTVKIVAGKPVEEIKIEKAKVPSKPKVKIEKTKKTDTE